MASFLAFVVAAGNVLAVCMTTAIDNPVCYQQFFDLRKTGPRDPRLYYERYANGTIIETNHTMITLSACNQACGSAPNAYNFWDIQQRIATWIVPLFILIGSMHFVPLGKWNAVQVTVHLLADPINSFRCLLSKLATYQRWYATGQSSDTLPPETGKDIAMILLSYDAWQEILSCREGHVMTPTAEEMERTLTTWLEGSPGMPEIKRLARLRACRTAANELADCRASGLSKTLIGTSNYVVIIAASLVHIVNGDFNDRTGHSIAFAMLYSWLVPTVLLSSMVGGFVSKYSSKDVLERLQKEFTNIELSSANTSHDNVIPQIYPFAPSREESPAAAYESLPWCGGNYTFCPRQSRWGHQHPKTIKVVAIIPTLLAMCSAVFMSYTSPTRGIGCRSVQQFLFYVAWVISAILTYVFQSEDPIEHGHEPDKQREEPAKQSAEQAEHLEDRAEHLEDPVEHAGTATVHAGETARPAKEPSAQRQWRKVLIKDMCILVPQVIAFLAGFFGWFNSCFCWSAWFSRFGRAYVVLDLQEQIKALAGLTWPVLTLLPLLVHCLFVFGIWAVFKGGAQLFSISEKERNAKRTCIIPAVDDGLSRASTILLPTNNQDRHPGD